MPLEENLDVAEELLDKCHRANIIMELEIGVVGGEEDGVTAAHDAKLFSTPEDGLATAASGQCGKLGGHVGRDHWQHGHLLLFCAAGRPLDDPAHALDLAGFKLGHVILVRLRSDGDTLFVLHVLRCPRLGAFRNVHGTSADERTTGHGDRQFRECCPNRHSVLSCSGGTRSGAETGSPDVPLCLQKRREVHLRQLR